MYYRIYYGDGSIFEAPGDGGPEITPARNVQVIIQIDVETGPYFQTSTHYYVWWDERWLGVDEHGLYDYMIEPGWKRVLYGRTITNKEYLAIYKRAGIDKQTWRPWERKP